MKSIGVDGCKYGWVTASLQEKEVKIFKTFKEVVDHYKNGYSLLVDIPIGLPGPGFPERNCEALARRILAGKRKSSVFTVPCRQAVYADSYQQANTINRETLLKGISKQAWHICSKIKEVDQLLIERKEMRPNVKESHPELAFHWLNKGSSMLFNKKTQAGQAERIELLATYHTESKILYQEAVAEFKRKDVAKDDILDAICLAVSCCLMADRKQTVLMSNVDEEGIQMAIHCYRPAS